MTILDEILAHKRGEVAAAKQQLSAAALAAEAAQCERMPRGFRSALLAGASPAVIAEIKRRSPSKGLIRADFEPVALAKSYCEGGAAALSVLTDEHFFGGHLDFLAQVRAAVDLPLLRKDFVVDSYQIDEALLAGADCILLIVAALSPNELAEFHAYARRRRLDVLVEIHDSNELESALAVDANLIGVNNRNLKTFEVDLATTERLAARLFERLSGTGDEIALVAESGIHTPEDIERLKRAGAVAFLVGESLMRQPDVSAALAQLRRTS